MTKEYCFHRMTNSVEIYKQLSSLNFINVKLKSKQSLDGNFLSVQFTENECKLDVKCSTEIYRVMFNVMTVSSVNSEN